MKAIRLSILMVVLFIYHASSFCQQTTFLGIRLNTQYRIFSNLLLSKGFKQVSSEEIPIEKETAYYYRGEAYGVPCSMTIYVDNINKRPFRFYVFGYETSDTLKVIDDFNLFKLGIDIEYGDTAQYVVSQKDKKTAFSLDGISLLYPHQNLLLSIKSSMENNKTRYQSVIVLFDSINDKRHRQNLKNK